MWRGLSENLKNWADLSDTVPGASWCKELLAKLTERGSHFQSLRGRIHCHVISIVIESLMSLHQHDDDDDDEDVNNVLFRMRTIGCERSLKTQSGGWRRRSAGQHNDDHDGFDSVNS